MKLNMSQFKGTAPKLDAALLPEDMAQTARDIDLSKGIIYPDYTDKKVTSAPPSSQSMYLYNQTNWFFWDKKVKVIRDFVYGDDYNRIIIQGADDELLITDSEKLLSAPYSKTIDRSNAYVLGIPRLESFTMEVQDTPTENPNTDTRSYVVALVRKWSDNKIDIGGLSEPAKTASGEITVNVESGQTVKLTNIKVPTDTRTSTGATHIYIYRSEVGTETVGYSYVTELELTSAETYTFTDDVAGTDLAESAVSQSWDAPVSGLRGLLSLNNGVIAAYKGSTVYFSYPYQPYAFPVNYSVAIDAEIVGLGAFGNTVVVCTKTNPILLLVADPAAVTVTPIQQSIPCLSEYTIGNTASGVLYVTPNGTAQIDSYAYTLLTKDIVSSLSYNDINTEDMSAVVHDDKYLMIFAEGSREFGGVVDIDDVTTGLTTFSHKYKFFWVDETTSKLYAALDTSTSLSARSSTSLDIVEFSGNTEYKNAFWKSKLLISSQGIITLSAARIDADYADEYPDLPEIEYNPINNSINTFGLNETTIAGTSNNQNYIDSIKQSFPVIFSYIVDGKIRYTRYCGDAKPFRLPSGFRGRRMEFQIETKIPVRQLDVSTSMGELM